MKESPRHIKDLLCALRDASVVPESGLTDTKSWHVAVRLLGELGRCRQAYVIHHLAPYLFSAHHAVQLGAIKALSDLLMNLKPFELAAVDERMRRRSFAYHDDLQRQAWVNAQPSQCDQLLSRETLLVGLLACHPNGFVRALAVESLTARNDGAELSFLLIRSTDWVPQVQRLAQMALERRLRRDYVSHFLRNLALIDQLKVRRRAHDFQLFEALDKFLIEPSNRDLLLLVAEKEDDVSNRRRRFALALSCHSENPEEVIRIALQEPDQQLRHRALKFAVQALPLETLHPIVRAILQDSAASIRICALEFVLSRDLPDADERLVEALCDKSSTVREFARYYLRDRQSSKIHENFAAFYTGELRSTNISRQGTIAALAGLAETGKAGNLDIVKPFLNHDKTSVVKQALRTIAALDAKGNLELLTNYLGDSRAGVSRTASAALEKFVDELDESKLWEVFDGSHAFHAKKNTVRLFNYMSEWERFGCLLTAATVGPSAITAICELNLGLWLKQYGTTYGNLRPSRKVAKCIVDASPVVNEKLTPELLKKLEPALKFSHLEHEKFMVENEV